MTYDTFQLEACYYLEESLLTSARRVDPKTEPGMSSGQDDDLSNEGCCFRFTLGVNVSLRMYLLLTFFNAISVLEDKNGNFLHSFASIGFLTYGSERLC